MGGWHSCYLTQRSEPKAFIVDLFLNFVGLWRSRSPILGDCNKNKRYEVRLQKVLCGSLTMYFYCAMHAMCFRVSFENCLQCCFIIFNRVDTQAIAEVYLHYWEYSCQYHWSLYKHVNKTIHNYNDSAVEEGGKYKQSAIQQSIEYFLKLFHLKSQNRDYIQL